LVQYFSAELRNGNVNKKISLQRLQNQIIFSKLGKYLLMNVGPHLPEQEDIKELLHLYEKIKAGKGGAKQWKQQTTASHNSPFHLPC